MNRLGLTPRAELGFWLTAAVMLTPVAAFYYLTYPPEWLYFAIKQGTLLPKMWR
jgi:hypothetical protein